MAQARHTLKLTHLEVDGRFTKALETSLETAVRKAAREWLRSIVERVPQWSGETIGSFANASGPDGFLGQFLRLHIDINPTHPKRFQGALKGPETGGEKAYYNFTSGQHKFQFYYHSDVFQWAYNEFIDQTTGPRFQLERAWRLREEAREAYATSIDDSMKKIPKIKDYLVGGKDFAQGNDGQIFSEE